MLANHYQNVAMSHSPVTGSGPPLACRAAQHTQGLWKRGLDSSKQECSHISGEYLRQQLCREGMGVRSGRCGARELVEHGSGPDRPGKARQSTEGAWQGSYHLGKKPATPPNPLAHTPGEQRPGCPEMIGGFGIWGPRADEKIAHYPLRYVRCVRRDWPTIPATK